MKFAVIGGGISGLVAADRLQGDHEVTLFEANDYVGGHTHTVDVEVGGERHAIDTGFIVHNETTYPNLTRLFSELGVATQPTSMTFSVRCDRTGLEYRGADLNGLFAQRRNLLSWRFQRMLVDVVRFNRQARRVVAGLDEEVTVGAFFQAHHFSSKFIEHYFLPMASAVWSCPLGQVERMPMRFILEFYRNHGLLQTRGGPSWRVVVGGSRAYVAALLGRFRGVVRVNCPVRSIKRGADGVDVRMADSTGRFDHVVVACHSDQALHLLGADATAVERDVLGAFPYEQNVAVLHTDWTLLPRSRRAWASWNYRVSPPSDADAKATVTYNMNLLQGLEARQVFCVTLNDERSIAPHKVLRRITYHHPIFTTRRTAAQRRHPELINQNRTSFCGAYWGNGFHEDGVNSALAVCRGLARGSRRQLGSERELAAVAAHAGGPPAPRE